MDGFLTVLLIFGRDGSEYRETVLQSVSAAGETLGTGITAFKSDVENDIKCWSHNCSRTWNICIKIYDGCCWAVCRGKVGKAIACARKFTGFGTSGDSKSHK